MPLSVSSFPDVPSFTELLASCAFSAVHLEMRDAYASNDRFEAWRAGHRIDWENRSTWWHPYNEAVADAVARGVVVRRGRIISEPVSEYIRWEHYVTRANILSGERVGWLPRRRTTDLSLPGNDFWVFDNSISRIHHFSGDGAVVEDELTDDRDIVQHCVTAFEAVWARSIPHDEYKV